MRGSMHLVGLTRLGRGREWLPLHGSPLLTSIAATRPFDFIFAGARGGFARFKSFWHFSFQVGFHDRYIWAVEPMLDRLPHLGVRGRPPVLADMFTSAKPDTNIAAHTDNFRAQALCEHAHLRKLVPIETHNLTIRKWIPIIPVAQAGREGLPGTVWRSFAKAYWRAPTLQYACYLPAAYSFNWYSAAS